MLKKLAILAILIVIAAVAYGAAASLNVSGGAIQYGIDTDLTCDDAVAVTGWGLETDTNLVYYVKIGDIDPACAGNALFVKVLDSGNAVLAQGKVDPIANSEEKINFVAPVNAESIAQLKVWIEGPVP
jgi:hypothetical protein